jgi:uncharacterized protein (TIRG00374 family)
VNVGPVEPASAGPNRAAIARRVALLAVALVVLYFFAPTIGEVLNAWPQLAHVNPAWIGLAIVSEFASFACVWWLLSIALRSHAWFAIATSQLSANALSRVVPAGAAAGATLQYRMLATSGVDTAAAGSALTAATLLQLSTLAALPVVGLLLSLGGRPINHGLQAAAWVGLVAFGVLVGIGAILVTSDGAVTRIGMVFQWAHNRVFRHRPAMTDLPDRLRTERNHVSRELGERWRTALLASVGKWAFDFGALLAALAAVGAKPDPSLVLFAYAASAVLALIPITPGGLGFVEAGLTGVLALAGIGAGDAVVATLIYRLVSFWLPLPAGLGAYTAFRVRQRRVFRQA